MFWSMTLSRSLSKSLSSVVGVRAGRGGGGRSGIFEASGATSAFEGEKGVFEGPATGWTSAGPGTDVVCSQ